MPTPLQTDVEAFAVAGPHQAWSCSLTLSFDQSTTNQDPLLQQLHVSFPSTPAQLAHLRWWSSSFWCADPDVIAVFPVLAPHPAQLPCEEYQPPIALAFGPRMKDQFSRPSLPHIPAQPIPNFNAFSDLRTAWYFANSTDDFIFPMYGANLMRTWQLQASDNFIQRDDTPILGIIDTHVMDSHKNLASNRYRDDLAYDVFRDSPFLKWTHGVCWNHSIPKRLRRTYDCHGTNVAGLAVASVLTEGSVGTSRVAQWTQLVVAPFLPTRREPRCLLAKALQRPLGNYSIFTMSFGLNSTLGPGDSDDCMHLISTVSSSLLLSNRGLGRAFTKSAGNDKWEWDTAWEPHNQMATSIPVQALTAYGTLPSYAQFGSSMLISAPVTNCGDAGDPQSLETCSESAPTWTADLPGIDGSSIGDYSMRFAGTSAAAPIVGGILADIMAYVYPETLGYIDLIGILIQAASSTVQKCHQLRGVWGPEVTVTNAAGYTHNLYCGFGMIDAGKAFEVALDRWIPVGYSDIFPINPPATSSFTPWSECSMLYKCRTSTITVSPQLTRLSVAHVRVCITAIGVQPSDSSLRLTSPSGTRAVLLMPMLEYAGPSVDYVSYCIKAFQFWGEQPDGTWELELRTMFINHFPVLEWRLEVHAFRKRPCRACVLSDESLEPWATGQSSLRMLSPWGYTTSIVPYATDVPLDIALSGLTYSSIALSGGNASGANVCVATNDTSFASAFGLLPLPLALPGSEFNITTLPVGTACDCSNAVRPDGYARLDLTGTAYAVDRNSLSSWLPSGLAAHGYTVLQSDQLLEVWGSGSGGCGCYGPPPTLRLQPRPFAASCLALASATAALDSAPLAGRYTLYWGGDMESPFIAFCNGNSTFLPLPNEAERHNDITVSTNCEASWRGTNIVAQFRLVPVTEVLTGNATWWSVGNASVTAAQPGAVLVFGNLRSPTLVNGGVYANLWSLSWQPVNLTYSFGQPPPCAAEPAFARVDLRGTPFGIANFMQYRDSTGADVIVESDQTMVLMSPTNTSAESLPPLLLYYRGFPTSCAEWIDSATAAGLFVGNLSASVSNVSDALLLPSTLYVVGDPGRPYRALCLLTSPVNGTSPEVQDFLDAGIMVPALQSVAQRNFVSWRGLQIDDPSWPPDLVQWQPVIRLNPSTLQLDQCSFFSVDVGTCPSPLPESANGPTHHISFRALKQRREARDIDAASLLHRIVASSPVVPTGFATAYANSNAALFQDWSLADVALTGRFAGQGLRLHNNRFRVYHRSTAGASSAYVLASADQGRVRLMLSTRSTDGLPAPAALLNEYLPLTSSALNGTDLLAP